MSNEAIAFRGVRKTHGTVVAVDRVDFTVPAGSFVGFVGHNGAGKSTCINMLIGLLRPDEGEVWVDGVNVWDQPVVARQRFGAVPQQPAVYPWLTAREFFEFVREVRGAGEVDRALEIANLGDDAERVISGYSEGMTRRTALAAALMGTPQVLVLDEALNGLDPPSAARVKGILRQMVDDGGTVLLSTHVVETVEAVADRIVVLAHGRVVRDLETAELGDGGLDELFRDLDAGRA